MEITVVRDFLTQVRGPLPPLPCGMVRQGRARIARQRRATAFGLVTLTGMRRSKALTFVGVCDGSR